MLEVDADATTGSVADTDGSVTGDAELGDASPPEGDPTSYDRGRRRYTIASLVAAGLAAVPFLWILWSLWGPPDVPPHQ